MLKFKPLVSQKRELSAFLGFSASDRGVLSFRAAHKSVNEEGWIMPSQPNAVNRQSQVHFSKFYNEKGKNKQCKLNHSRWESSQESSFLCGFSRFLHLMYLLVDMYATITPIELF